jgi:hypothetical protein
MWKEPLIDPKSVIIKRPRRFTSSSANANPEEEYVWQKDIDMHNIPWEAFPLFVDQVQNPVDNFSIIFCPRTFLPIYDGVVESYPADIHAPGISLLIILTIVKAKQASFHAVHYSHWKVGPEDQSYARKRFEPLIQWFTHNCPSLRVHSISKGKISPALIIKTIYEAMLSDNPPPAINEQLLPMSAFGNFHCASDFSGMEGPSYSVNQLIKDTIQQVKHQWLSDSNPKVMEFLETNFPSMKPLRRLYSDIKKRPLP